MSNEPPVGCDGSWATLHVAESEWPPSLANPAQRHFQPIHGVATVSRPVGGVLYARRRGGHPSNAAYLGMLSPERQRAGHPFPHLALLRVGFAEPPGSPRALVRSYRTVSPLPVPRGAIGGLFSVALSCGSPRLASRQHPALWSPDLPRHDRSKPSCRGHPAGSPSPPVCQWGCPTRPVAPRSGPADDVRCGPAPGQLDHLDGVGQAILHLGVVGDDEHLAEAAP